MSTTQPGKPRIKLPGEDIDTTTEAHIVRSGRIEDADTEGHVIRFRGVEPAGDDGTEGHGRRFPSDDESVNRNIDSTEGHAARSNRVEDADTEGHGAKVRFVDEAGTDTTEGHRFKGAVEEAELVPGRGLDDADTEGHAARNGRVEDADTEGHAASSRRVEPAGDDDNTEGHPLRIK